MTTRTRQLRIRRDEEGTSAPAEERLEARRRRRNSPPIVEEIPPESEVQEVESDTPADIITDDSPIVGGQRESRADRVMENYPNMDSNPITEIMRRMKVEGNLTLIIYRHSEDKWRCAVGERVPRITNPAAFTGRLPRNFTKDTFHTPEFIEWSSSWNEKTFEEKIAFAKEHGIEWDSDHPSEKVRKKNLGLAVRLYHRIQKYKPEYSGQYGRAARRQAREKAKIVT